MTRMKNVGFQSSRWQALYLITWPVASLRWIPQAFPRHLSVTSLYVLLLCGQVDQLEILIAKDTRFPSTIVDR